MRVTIFLLHIPEGFDWNEAKCGAKLSFQPRQGDKEVEKGIETSKS